MGQENSEVGKHDLVKHGKKGQNRKQIKIKNTNNHRKYQSKTQQTDTTKQLLELRLQ